jgi:hypothetical protein
MQVTAGYVTPEGNFCNCLDAGNIDGFSNVKVDKLTDDIEVNGVVNMTVECLNNSVGRPVCVHIDNTIEEIYNGATNDARADNVEDAPWNASSNINYACVQALLERSQCVPAPLLMQVLLTVRTKSKSQAVRIVPRLAKALNGIRFDDSGLDDENNGDESFDNYLDTVKRSVSEVLDEDKDKDEGTDKDEDTNNSKVDAKDANDAEDVNDAKDVDDAQVHAHNYANNNDKEETPGPLQVVFAVSSFCQLSH